METHKSSIRIFFIAGNSALGSFFCGYCMGYMNVSFLTISEVFSINPNKTSTIEAIINCLLPLGAGIGAFGSSLLLIILRKKNSLMVTDIIGIVGSILGLFVHLEALYCSRLILGIAVGLNSSIVPQYIKEFSPINLRGLTGSFYQTFVNIGVQLPFFLGLYFIIFSPFFSNYKPSPQNTYWRLVFGLPAVLCIIRMLILEFIFNDDPPSYYVEQKNDEKALKILSQIYKEEYVQQVFADIQIEKQYKKNSKFSDLCTKLYERRFVTGCLLFVLQQLCGINSIIFYSNDIFQQVLFFYYSILRQPLSNPQQIGQQQLLDLSILSLLFWLEHFQKPMAGFYTVSQIVIRKQLFEYGNLSCFFCLITLFVLSFYNTSTADSFGPIQISIISFIYLYLFSVQISLNPVAWIYNAEILPEKGMSLAVVVNWSCVTLVTFGFPIVVDKWGIQYCFLFFAFITFLGIFFIRFMILETSGKSEEAIEKLFQLTDMPETSPLIDEVKN